MLLPSLSVFYSRLLAADYPNTTKEDRRLLLLTAFLYPLHGYEYTFKKGPKPVCFDIVQNSLKV